MRYMNSFSVSPTQLDLPSDLMESFIDEIGVATPSDKDAE